MQNQKQINFEYINNLIIVIAAITGKNNERRRLRCAVDTACGITTVRTDVIDSLGYGAIDGERISNVISSSGKDQGYLIKVAKFAFGGFEFKDHLVDAFSLSEEIGVDCLIGNDILSQYRVNIDYKNESIEFQNNW